MAGFAMAGLSHLAWGEVEELVSVEYAPKTFEASVQGPLAFELVAAGPEPGELVPETSVPRDVVQILVSDRDWRLDDVAKALQLVQEVTVDFADSVDQNPR